MTSFGTDSLKTRRTLLVGGRNYEYFPVPAAAQRLGDISRLPISLKILLESILRLDGTRDRSVAVCWKRSPAGDLEHWGIGTP